MLDFGARDTLYIKRTTTNTYTFRYNLSAKEPLHKKRPKNKEQGKKHLLFKTHLSVKKKLGGQNSRK